MSETVNPEAPFHERDERLGKARREPSNGEFILYGDYAPAMRALSRGAEHVQTACGLTQDQIHESAKFVEVVSPRGDDAFAGWHSRNIKRRDEAFALMERLNNVAMETVRRVAGIALEEQRDYEAYIVALNQPSEGTLGNPDGKLEVTGDPAGIVSASS